MPSAPCSSSTPRSCAIAAVLAGAAAAVAAAGPALPDPCKLIAAAELEQIVGPLKRVPKATDPASGEISCEYEPAKGPAWIGVSLHDGELVAWRKRNGGKSPVDLPELGKDAFVNTDFEGTTDLYAKKGVLVLNVSLPKGPQSVETAKAIAKKALGRL